MRKSEQPFQNEVTAHFKALGTLRKTIHLLPVGTRRPMARLLQVIRKAERQRLRELLRAHAEFQREKEARDEAS